MALDRLVINAGGLGEELTDVGVAIFGQRDLGLMDSGLGDPQAGGYVGRIVVQILQQQHDGGVYLLLVSRPLVIRHGLFLSRQRKRNIHQPHADGQ